MHFQNSLTIIQLFLPPICTGLLLTGFILYAYLSFNFKSTLYWAITILGFLAFIFVGCETGILIYGSWMKKEFIGMQFHRIEQISGAFFFFAFPNLLINLLKLNEKWKKFNKFLTYSGLFLAIAITVLALLYPDLYISINKHKPTYLTYESDYGRGNEGLVYFIRDIFLFAVIVYGVVCIIIDFIWYKNREIISTFIAILIAIFGAITDILYVHTGKNFDILPNLVYSRFSAGLTLMVFILMANIIRKFIISTKELEKANIKITVSEEKYKLLAEGTNDCIFSLDNDFYFLSANEQALRQFNIDSENLSKTNFFDLIIYFAKDYKKTALELIKQKFYNLKKTEVEMNFTALIIPIIKQEPIEYGLKFDYINLENRKEFIGKAEKKSEEILMKFIERECLIFSINNFISSADEVSNRIVLNLLKSLSSVEINELKLGIRELIINAIEHGNLEITFNEKTEATSSGSYLSFLIERQNNPKYKDKIVTIEYSLSKQKFVCRITNQGKGFNYSNVLQKLNRVKPNELFHGKGITIAKSIFDKMAYNKTGNQVTVIKYLNNNI